MKVKKNDLLNFMKKINMSGEHIVDLLAWNFNDNGLSISLITDDKTIKVDGLLPKKLFKEYKNIGIVGIQELSKLLSIIRTFDSDEIEINVNDNVLELCGGRRKVEVFLIDSQFLPESKSYKQLDFKETLTLPVNVIQKFINDASINQEFGIIFETTPNQLIIRNTGKFKFTETIPIENVVGNIKTKFTTPFIDAVKNLNGDIKFSIDNKMPGHIIEETENSWISILIAPSIIKE